MNARYVEGLKDFVGDAKYGIFFPSKGPRSMADEIAGGDYDGDMYWVSTNSELLKFFKPSEPWKCNSLTNVNNKSLPSAETLECELMRLYSVTRFHQNEAIAKAADWWLAYMDQLLTLGDDRADEKVVLMKKIDQLVDLYYDALDSPKKGLKLYVTVVLKPDKYPHHMGRGEDCTYKSKSILGEIHDIVDQFIAPIKFWKLKCFDVEIPEVHLADWTNYYSTYRTDMLRALNESEDFAAVYQQYRMVLYGGVDDLESSEKDWEEIQLEALAIYHVCYDYAILIDDPKKCGFAWKVAVDALLKIYLNKLKTTGEKPILFATLRH